MKERMMRLRRLCAVTLSAALVLGGTETTYMVSAEEFSNTEVFADHSGVSPEEADDAEISTPDIEGENLSGGGYQENSEEVIEEPQIFEEADVFVDEEEMQEADASGNVFEAPEEGELFTSEEAEGAAGGVQEDGSVVINAENFPDEAFRSYIEGSFDTDSDGVLTAAEISKITKVSVSGNQEVLSLEGIEYLTNVQLLYLDNTNIASLDVRANSKLRQLQCTNTKLTELVLDNPQLVYVYCYNNELLTRLDVSQAGNLETLSCNNTGLSSIDISKNSNLVTLQCYGLSKLTELDVTQNKKLAYLDCDSTGITSLDVTQNPDLYYLDCDGTKLENIDVIGNKKLRTLYCSRTGITSLDVTKNPVLFQLSCSVVNLKSLDVTQNPELESLGIANTQITSLDVSNNKKLKQLNCNGTQVRGLDVSSCTILEELYCTSPYVGYVNIGTKDALRTMSIGIGPNVFQKTGIINLTVQGESFDITEVFPGIDVERMTINSGAERNGNLISNYGEENEIKYTYDCGTALNGEAKTMDVTLKLTIQKQQNTIAINKDLNTAYTGTPVSLTGSDCTVTAEGEITFTYYKLPADGTEWEVLDSAPADAGTYKVIAKVAETANYYEAESEPLVFTIEKAEPVYTVPPEVKAIYGQTLAELELPEGFSWMDDTQSVGNAGSNTFQARFTPEDTANYEVVENIDVTVTVEKAAPVYTVPTNLKAVYGQTLAEIELPEGFAWTDDTQSVGTVGSNTFQARFTPEDTANYEVAENIDITVTVEKAAPVYTIPANLKAVYGQTLAEIELPNGWEWKNGAQIITLKETAYMARLAVDDVNYDYSQMEGYDPVGHCVEIMLKISVECLHTGDTEVRNAKEATHISTGYTGDIYCKICKEKLRSGTTIAMLPYTSADITANSNVLNVNAKLAWSGKKVKVSWSKVSEAQGYDIYAAKCGKSLKLVQQVQSGTTSALISKASGAALKATGNYKVKVRAYRMVNGKKKYIANSLTLHIMGKSNKTYTNASKVKVSKSSYTLSKGKSVRISTTVTKQNSKKKLPTTAHAARLRYFSTNKKVATVGSAGKIKAVGKGSCYVYVVAQNGAKARVKVTVK